MVADTSGNGNGSKLVSALIAAKKKFKPLHKNRVNPYFKSKYADLAALHEAVDEGLSENGLTVMQPMFFDEKYGHHIRTELLHTSGESKVSVYPLPGGVKPQELASAITYARRISLAAILAIPADDDDDGESTEGRTEGKTTTDRKEQQKKADAKPDKATPSWRGTIAAIEEIKPKLWKVTGGDTSTFATATPEHKAVAETAGKSLAMVEIVYKLNSVGAKLIESIKEVKQ